MAGTVNLARSGRRADIVLSNPERLNALTWQMYDEFEAACREIAADPQCRVVTIAGDGGVFAAGTDIAQFTSFRSGADGVAYEQNVERILDGILALPMPVVAVVDGPAVGAGLAIASCCDIVLAGEDAYFGAPIARTLGNCLSSRVVARLQSRLGRNRVMALLLTGRRLSAADAQQAGFVHTVTPSRDLWPEADALAERLLSEAPLTLKALKEIDRRIAAHHDQELAGDLLEACYGSDDFKEGVDSFVNSRQPVWTGR